MQSAILQGEGELWRGSVGKCLLYVSTGSPAPRNLACKCITPEISKMESNRGSLPVSTSAFIQAYMGVHTCTHVHYPIAPKPKLCLLNIWWHCECGRTQTWILLGWWQRPKPICQGYGSYSNNYLAHCSFHLLFLPEEPWGPLMLCLG